MSKLDDLLRERENALQEQMKAFYAAEKAKLQQPDEFSRFQFMESNDIPLSKKDYARTILNEAVRSGKMTVRDGLRNGHITKLYKFVVAPDAEK